MCQSVLYFKVSGEKFDLHYISTSNLRLPLFIQITYTTIKGGEGQTGRRADQGSHDK